LFTRIQQASKRLLVINIFGINGLAQETISKMAESHFQFLQLSGTSDLGKIRRTKINPSKSQINQP
jgi:hypothetical protein